MTYDATCDDEDRGRQIDITNNPASHYCIITYLYIISYQSVEVAGPDVVARVNVAFLMWVRECCRKRLNRFEL